MTIWEMVTKDEELRKLRQKHYEMTGKGFPYSDDECYGIEDYRRKLKEKIAKLEEQSNSKEP